MNDVIQIRERPSKPGKPRCVLCASIDYVERHHLGGRNHVVWITAPLCRRHHTRLTRALKQAGVNMSYTPDKRVRIARARMATLVFFWMLEEELQEYEKGMKRQ